MNDDIDFGNATCPACGRTVRVERLYTHGRNEHGWTSDDWADLGLNDCTCLRCGERMSLAGAAGHLRRKTPCHRPEARIVPCLGSLGCGRCGVMLVRRHDMEPYCVLSCPDCRAWWPLTRASVGGASVEDDDPHWRDPEVLDAYTRFCESYEDVEALIRTLRILHKDTRDYDRQRRLILDEDVRVLESVEGLDDAADSMDTLRMDLLNDLHKATRPHRYTVMRPRRRVI